MQLKKEISEELGLLSMVVAGIDRQVPYEVPQGYFEGFPDKMLSLLERDTLEQALPPGLGKEPAFSVPSGYFEGFASKMMDKIKAAMGEQMPDTGENIQLSGNTLPDAREELAGLSPLLSRIDKKMPFQVPDGYFESLSPLIETPSPLIAGLKDHETYQTPEGYFESLPEIIIGRVQPAKEKTAPARVISMNRTRGWWKYSAAAVVAGFIFTVGWLRLHNTPARPGSNNTDVAQGLAKISDQDIDNYLDNQDNHTPQFQQDEPFDNSTASLDISDNDVKSFLGDISDGDLTQYMAEHGNLKDYPTN